ncbi:MAG: sn-glycerol-1-phosphate dehydrogenase [Deltaproteobacteria bacterium]|nr:sn-glycerol-1-phosphate dehydrogenase [Deltaproteobacteria bacterium]
MTDTSKPNKDMERDSLRELAQPPVELRELLRYSASCRCGRDHSVDIADISLREHAIEDLPSILENFGQNQRIVVVADRVTREIAGDSVQRITASAGHRVGVCVVPDGIGGRPHADETALEIVQRSLAQADLALAVGSGTINDLVKLASFRRTIPYVVVATAPSMNGYTSAISAITVRGVKRTIDCRQPYAVIADLAILCRAPRDLTLAGLGDLESKPTATADYRLGGRLRRTYYCPAPERVVRRAEERAAGYAEGINRGDPEAMAALTEALLLSGISMKLAGSSSPASGGEHLMSHFWDMTASEENRIEGWHGAQVGVCTMVTAALYEQLREIRPDSLDIEAIAASRPSVEEITRQIRRRHGTRANEVVSEYFDKHLSNDDLYRELEDLKQHWDEIWGGLSDTLRPAGAIRRILATAGASITVQQIGLTPRHLKTSFLAAREIRGRFTVLDLAADLGLLEKLCDDAIKIAIG